MKRIPVLLAAVIFCFPLFAQNAKEMHENARMFIKQGDHANAILILNRAIELEPGNQAIIKDLALSYYFQNDQARALETIKPLLERDDADDQSFIIAGNIYKSLGQPKEAEKLQKKGLKKFPSSGALYNDHGETLWAMKDPEAIKQWEKGIETDPSYSKNYYNAAMYYFLSGDRMWSLLYGEIFVNMEPFSSKTPEVKDILLDNYKKLFSESSIQSKGKENKFTKSYLETLNRQSSLASAGIGAESLAMIRTRFILDWFNEKNRPAFKLFDHHRQLLQEGLFDAYNQWLFGSAQNLSNFQNWINSHPDEYAAFTAFQRSKLFRIPEGEYYK